MGYKAKAGKPYKDKHGNENPEAYAMLDWVHIGNYRKKASFVLSIFPSQAIRDAETTEPYTMLIPIIETVDADGIPTTHFEDFLADLKIKPDGITHNKKGYEYINSFSNILEDWDTVE